MSELKYTIGVAFNSPAGEDIDQVALRKELAELERLAEIGKAVEWAFKNEMSICEEVPSFEYNDWGLRYSDTKTLIEDYRRRTNSEL